MYKKMTWVDPWNYVSVGGGADPARRRDNFTGSFFELKCIRL